MQCNLNSNLIDFYTELQLTARIELDRVNKDKISPKQNYLDHAHLSYSMKNQTLKKFLHIDILRL